MKRKTWTILLGIVVAGLFVQYARPQGCTPGYSAGWSTIGNIQTQCVFQYPAPQTRTDVGIGEQVTCSIDPSTWQGYAIYTDAYCNQSQVSDSLGEITWSVSGPGSVYPTTGYSTTLTVDLADEDGVIAVSATATDWLAVNPPVQRQQALNEKVPKGSVPLSATDAPNATWVQGMANLGAGSNILFQIQPNTVNFGNGTFQVPFSGVPNLIWPNQDKNSIAAVTWGGWQTENVGATQNLKTFPMSYGLVPVGKIAGQNFTIPNSGILQYRDKGGKWTGINSFSGIVQFSGATNKTQLGLSLTDASNKLNTLLGGAQGPWQ